jgi:hypothetical protein
MSDGLKSSDSLQSPGFFFEYFVVSWKPSKKISPGVIRHLTIPTRMHRAEAAVHLFHVQLADAGCLTDWLADSADT